MRLLFVAGALTFISACLVGNIASQQPWLAQLEWGNDTICTGAIMSEEYVVLLAQCVHNTDTATMTIRAGSSIRHSGSNHTIRDIRIHPDFLVDDVYDWKHDIAVVNVDPPFAFSQQTMAIPKGTEYPSSGSQGYATGWIEKKKKRRKEEPLSVVAVDLNVDNSNDECVMDEIGQLFCAGTSNVDAACSLYWGAPFIQDGRLVGLATIIETCRLYNTYVSVALPSNRGFIDRVLNGN